MWLDDAGLLERKRDHFVSIPMRDVVGFLHSDGGVEGHA